MAKRIIIDIDVWATPINYAKEIGVTKQVITNWISRGKIEKRIIPELGLTLVRKGVPK